MKTKQIKDDISSWGLFEKLLLVNAVIPMALYEFVTTRNSLINQYETF